MYIILKPYLNNKESQIEFNEPHYDWCLIDVDPRTLAISVRHYTYRVTYCSDIIDFNLES